MNKKNIKVNTKKDKGLTKSYIPDPLETRNFKRFIEDTSKKD